jgi:hypothetical protein
MSWQLGGSSVCFSLFFINTLALIRFFLGYGRHLKLLSWYVIMRRESFFLIIGVLKVLLFILCKVVLVKELCIFADVLEIGI